MRVCCGAEPALQKEFAMKLPSSLFVGFATCCLLPFTLALAAQATDAPARAAAGADKTIHLVIDYNDGVEKHFTRVPWKAGMTVLDTLQHAKSVPHGVDFEFGGSGATALVTRIDDLTNQRGAQGRNWLFWVNGEFAKKGCGVYELQPSDRVTWRFDEWKHGR
jgi:hypothetical protein